MAGWEISDVEDKLQLLLNKLSSLHAEKVQLEEKLLEKDKKTQQLKEQLEEYEDKIRIIKMTSPSEEIEGNDFRKEVRSTINGYIKEIDHCIAMLNK